MSKRMTRQQAEDCFLSGLDIDASNVETFERILMLPFVVFRVVAEALCSGELTLADFDGRLFELERRASQLAELEDVDVEALVRDSLASSAGPDAKSAAAAAAAGALSELPAPGLVVLGIDQSRTIEQIAIAAYIDEDCLDGFRPSGRSDGVPASSSVEVSQAQDAAAAARREADELRARSSGQPGAAGRIAAMEASATAAEAAAEDARKRAARA